MALKAGNGVSSVTAEKVGLGNLLDHYKKILADYKDKVNVLGKYGINTYIYQPQLTAFQSAVDEGRIAEAERLSRLGLFLQMNELIGLLELSPVPHPGLW